MLKDDGKDVYEDNDDSKNLDLVERSGGEESEDEFENDLALVIHGNSTLQSIQAYPWEIFDNCLGFQSESNLILT